MLVRPSYAPLAVCSLEAACTGGLRTWARSCLLRGEAEASTTLCRRSVFSDNRFNGGGGPGGGLRAPGVPEGDLLCALGALGASSYGGGGSDGTRLFDMAVAAVRRDVATMRSRRR